MLLYIVVVSSIVAIANAIKVAPLTNPCSQKSFDLNECISIKLDDAKPYLLDGIPELSIPSLKHIYIPYSYLNRSNYEFGVWNYDITGLENFNILKVDVDPKENIFKIEIEFPYGEGNGSYGFKGNLFNLNFDGTGPIKVNGTTLIVNLVLKTKVVQRNGHNYLEKVNSHVNAKIHGSFYMYLYNLYSGNTMITEIMNLVIKDNSFYMFELVAPILENQIKSLLDKAIDNVFKTYTYEELLP
ncbi:PREDICTED: uncharacterized protein LOC108565834 [Nicrophorus vespilloides]|uniref:Uncharacterized protein LOC108565834 n=1 Tax=Nicrophorus vespilloides TaxID=110193 RepID=A0ABM1N2B9_NICVS|nr:PREDICTED: uncharacterized protein LOC108565834 [Nicrophorus vespilloides]